MERSMRISREFLVCLLLTAAVLTIYWPVSHFDFIACDDNIYVTENHHVREGLTGRNIIWAFTTTDTTNWHPLTWLSLLADSSIFGLQAGGYHVHNLLLHLANSLLFFFLLRRMTGSVVRSGCAAALFAIHPINVESVAWVAERKNVLSTFFWFVTIWTYAGYVAHPVWKRYFAVILLFAAGLLAKPMLITLPAVLLLIDYWPLRRFSSRGEAFRLIREKIPLFFLSVLSALVTLYVADLGGAVKSLSAFPLTGRIANALVSYACYLEKIVWPVPLAFFYPWRAFISPGQVILSVSLVAGMTAFVLWGARRWPYLTVGWFWYILTLVPVIGIVQVGYQAMADRYAYVPLAGIFMMMAWGIPDLLKYAHRRGIFMILWAGVIAALVIVSSNQVSRWQDSEKVFSHALGVTKENHMALNGMGYLSIVRGDHERAAAYLREALRIRPDYPEAMINMGIVYMKQGLFEDAIAQYGKALEASPTDAKILNNLGVALACKGRHEEAAIRFREALRRSPGYQEARENLAKVMKELKGSTKP